jgi:hypothetical protein
MMNSYLGVNEASQRLEEQHYGGHRTIISLQLREMLSEEENLTSLQINNLSKVLCKNGSKKLQVPRIIQGIRISCQCKRALYLVCRSNDNPNFRIC